jgi:hypothetical protein
MLDVHLAIKKLARILLLSLSLGAVAMAWGEVRGTALEVKPPPQVIHLSLEPMAPLVLRFERTPGALAVQSPSTRGALKPVDEPASGLMETQDAQQLKKLDADLRFMRAELVKREQDVSQLRVQLKKAKSERYNNALVYVLLVWLVLALACLASMMWPKKSKDSARWLESVMSVNARYETVFAKTVIAKPAMANKPPIPARATTAPRVHPVHPVHSGVTVEALEMRDTELKNLFEESVFPATALTESDATQVVQR